jgi:hypothetical protein
MEASAVTAKPDLRERAVLEDTYALYKRLFARSVALGLVVFGAVELVRTFVATRHFGAPALMLLIVTAALGMIGTALVQGALAESVREVHDGARLSNVGRLYERASARFGSLVGVSVLTSFGIVTGFLLLVVPGLVLATRWALAVPVVMVEGASPRAAMRRSRELVRGNGRRVFLALLNVWVRIGICSIPFALVAHGSFVAMWIATALGAALTTPYAAHAMSVLYYRLTEPERSVVPEPQRPWDSVWTDQDRR